MLKATLPEILKEISAKHAACVKDLEGLGEDLSTHGARRLKFSSIVNELCVLVRETTHGSNTEWDAGEGFTLRASLENMYREFAADMRKTLLAGSVVKRGAKVKVLSATKGRWLPGVVHEVKAGDKGENIFKVEPAATLEETAKATMKHVYRSGEVVYHAFHENRIRPDNYEFLKDRITKQQTRALQVTLAAPVALK